MKAFFLTALSLSFSWTASAQTCSVKPMQAELARRTEIDQAARAVLAKDFKNKVANDRALKIDADNTAWMRKLVAKCGWPKFSVVGEEAARQAWRLTQHADMAPDYQVYAAEKLKAAVLEHEAKPWDLAVLVDRNRRLQKQPQVYGMQFKEDSSGVIAFFDIERPELLDERRKEIGLEPFYCWIHEVSGDKGTPVAWPNGVAFKPAACDKTP